ncbi:hypothetical protein M885DRAFT_566396 [Pelagophyceae sp. CCMP2097]|nr:hypothetical protein M885DRAFT_566396 [Pelagophyceae sp. CCMP2097]
MALKSVGLREKQASLLNGVGDSLRAHLYGKLLAAVEDLLTDGHSVSGAFARWRAKASRLRLKDDAVVELGPAAVHRKIVQATHRLANPKAPDLVDLLVSDYASRAQAWATSIDAAPRASPGPASKAYTASRLTSRGEARTTPAFPAELATRG